ncbi:MAG: N(4)-(beta-N-acetylglucosaminyl)-L-asparaginase, partial [Planctomycetales bacterium]|nr:N(4)-(beta-N-acetylglucosaminyl)-L-asparaginase [Planctomycetales bacterium]
LIVSTWPFGKAANEQAMKALQAGGSPLDGVEAGIRQTEDSGNLSVGLSGKPNAAGFGQLDACIMNGPGHQAGSVAGLEGIRHPISVARRVMERTPHVMLVGQSARDFALSEGQESIDTSNHPALSAKWWAQQERQVRPTDVNADNHDTIALLVLGADGTLAGGCSTSGLAGKMPGRVGDSPILGSGLYVDNQVGAAGATGIGENVMRYCATFLIVEFMRQGATPTEACQQVIDRIRSLDPKPNELGICFVAVDKQGRYGAAGTTEFPYAVTYPGYSEVEKVAAYPGN